MRICVAPNCDALASEGVKEGAASTPHCEELTTIITKNKNEGLTQMHLDHFDPCELMKGSSTHAVSGMTHAPSLPSMARRARRMVTSFGPRHPLALCCNMRSLIGLDFSMLAPQQPWLCNLAATFQHV